MKRSSDGGYAYPAGLRGHRPRCGPSAGSGSPRGSDKPPRATSRGGPYGSGAEPIAPEPVDRYLKGKFGENLADVRKAMEWVAGSYPPKELAEKALSLYELFRPKIASGTRGWGQKDELDIALIESLAKGRAR